MRRQLLEQCQLRLVMVAPAAEAQEPKDSERQRQRQRIARVFRGMNADHRQRLGRGAADRQRDRLDMPLLANRNIVRQHSRSCRCFSRLPHSRLKLQQPCPRDVGECEIRIGGDRPLQQGVGANIGR
jgi:hypothetical protein